MEPALVSVVIPAYNPGAFLGIALQSLVAQTYSTWEAFVIDDGSTEDLSYVSRIDAPITLVRQENRGLSAARNAGIEQCNGTYVAFLDADDVWYPRKLETQVDLMSATPSMLASSTAFDIIDVSGVRVGPGYQGYHTFYTELLRGNGICVSTVMARNNALVDAGLFDLSYQQAQDWALWLTISKREPFGYLHEPAAGYRLHQGNMSGNYRRLLYEATAILNTHMRSACDPLVVSAATIGKHRIRRMCGIQAYDVFRESRRFRALIDAFIFAPSYTFRALVDYAISRT